MSKPKESGTWYGQTKAFILSVQCPKCLARVGAPCLNYKGVPKQSCPERMDLIRPRKRRRRRGRPWRQLSFLSSEKGAGG